MVRKRFTVERSSWCHGEEVPLPEQVIRWLNSWRSQKKESSYESKKCLINIEIDPIDGMKTNSFFSFFYLARYFRCML